MEDFVFVIHGGGVLEFMDFCIRVNFNSNSLIRYLFKGQTFKKTQKDGNSKISSFFLVTSEVTYSNRNVWKFWFLLTSGKY